MVAAAELSSSSFFRGFTDSQLNAIASVATPTHWSEGETVFQARSPAKRFYVLKSGAVLLCFPNGRSLPILHGGEAIGWSSLVSPFHYTATAICLTDTTLYHFAGSDLFGLIRMDSGLGHRLMDRIHQIMMERKPYRRSMDLHDETGS